MLNSESIPLVTFILASAAAAIILTTFLWRVWRYRSPPARALDALQADYVGAGFKLRVSPWHGGVIVSGAIDGTGFKLLAIEGHRNTITHLSVAGSAGSSFDISYSGSRGFSGRDFVAERFAEPQAQEAVRTLFAMGFSNVGCGRRGTYAVHFCTGEVPALPKLKVAVGLLAAVRDAEVRG